MNPKHALAWLLAGTGGTGWVTTKANNLSGCLLTAVANIHTGPCELVLYTTCVEAVTARNESKQLPQQGLSLKPPPPPPLPRAALFRAS